MLEYAVNRLASAEIQYGKKRHEYHAAFMFYCVVWARAMQNFKPGMANWSIAKILIWHFYGGKTC